MTVVTPEQAEAQRRQRRLINAVKERLRDLNIQLSVLDHQVSAKVDLKDVDFYCFDLINDEGPISPGALARRAGLHPATVTGILDRLERGGWIARERDPADRRAVRVRSSRERSVELFRHFAGMNASMDQLCAGYSDAELELIADFLHRTTAAGRAAADEVAGGS